MSRARGGGAGGGGGGRDGDDSEAPTVDDDDVAMVVDSSEGEGVVVVSDSDWEDDVLVLAGATGGATAGRASDAELFMEITLEDRLVRLSVSKDALVEERTFAQNLLWNKRFVERAANNNLGLGWQLTWRFELPPDVGWGVRAGEYDAELYTIRASLARSRVREDSLWVNVYRDAQALDEYLERAAGFGRGLGCMEQVRRKVRELHYGGGSRMNRLRRELYVDLHLMLVWVHNNVRRAV